MLFLLQRAHKYLVEKGKAKADVRQFKTDLYEIWFRVYHRDRNGG